ncbi:hypothetical protein RhiJN_10415 [Ceratobasidium sp. AG-Ba]|nr:hypothetical protein RhiJN_10415 [Ceratobasidium sp. AG-Ba]
MQPGCDLSNIERVVQWRVVGLSALIQRWGRSGRSGERALGILLYEPSAEKVNPTQPGLQVVAGNQPATKKRRQRSALLKGGFRSNVAGAEPDLQDDSPGEGVYALIQTNGCRRRIWNKVYGNKPVTLTVPCCDRCEPSVLDLIKTTKPPMERKAKLPPRGIPFKPAQRKLVEWRNAILERDFKGVTWSSSAILPHEIIESLTSYGPIGTTELFEQLVREKAEYKWWESYSKELGDLVLGLRIEYVPLPPKPKKRALDISTENNITKRAKNTHSPKPDDAACPEAVSTQFHSFRVDAQPPSVDMELNHSQAPPMMSSFSINPDSLPPTALSQVRLPSNETRGRPSITQYQHSYPMTPQHLPSVYPSPRYPQPTYPNPTYPHPAYPQPTYPYPTYPQPIPGYQNRLAHTSYAHIIPSEPHAQARPYRSYIQPSQVSENTPHRAHTTDLQAVYQDLHGVGPQNLSQSTPAASASHSNRQFSQQTGESQVQPSALTFSSEQVDRPTALQPQKHSYSGYYSTFRVDGWQ